MTVRPGDYPPLRHFWRLYGTGSKRVTELLIVDLKEMGIIRGIVYQRTGVELKIENLYK